VFERAADKRFGRESAREVGAGRGICRRGGPKSKQSKTQTGHTDGNGQKLNDYMNIKKGYSSIDRKEGKKKKEVMREQFE